MLWLCPSAWAQEDPKEIVLQAMRKMGGIAKVKKIKTVSIALNNESIKEFHFVRLKERMSLYRARRSSGRSLEVVLARSSAFVVERDEKNNATDVEDLRKEEIQEAGYDRDLFILPLLLPHFLTDKALLKYDGQVPNGDLKVTATMPPATASKEASVRYTLRFSKETGLLIGAKSSIPAGPDASRTRIIVFKNYKKAKNSTILVPTELKYKVDKDPVRSMSFRVKLDAKMPLKLYIKPKVSKPSAKPDKKTNKKTDKAGEPNKKGSSQ